MRSRSGEAFCLRHARIHSAARMFAHGPSIAAGASAPWCAPLALPSELSNNGSGTADDAVSFGWVGQAASVL